MIFKYYKNYHILGICYSNIGNIHMKFGRIDEAIESYQNSRVMADCQL